MPPKYPGRRTLLPIDHRQGGDSGGRQARSTTHADTNGGGDIEDRVRAGRPRPAAPPGRRSRSPILWQADMDTLFFKGPLGEPAGRVEKGLVLRECGRYEDPFGGWWFCARAEDGMPVWLSYYDPEVHPMEDPKEALWTRLFDIRATPESPATLLKDKRLLFNFHHPWRNAEGKRWSISHRDLLAARGSEEVPSDIAMIDFYWRHIDGKTERTPLGSWNERYQSAMEAYVLRSTTPESLEEHRSQLEAVLVAFQAAVEDCTVTVVEDLAKPFSEKKLKVHPGFRHVFFHDGILLKLVMDTASGALGGHINALKMAQQHFLSMRFLASECPKHFLSHPLYAMCSFKGHTLVACAIPPVTLDNCIYAPLAEAHERLGGVPLQSANLDCVMELCTALGSALNIKKHTIRVRREGEKTVKEWETPLTASLEIYAGKDSRLYLGTLASFLPPVPPLQIPSKPLSSPTGPPPPGDGSGPHDTVSIPSSTLLRRTRPEVLLRMPDPVNVDAFVDGCGEESDAQHLLSISEHQRGVAISSVADTLGFHRPMDQVRDLLPALCTLCGRSMEDEMRLVVCFNPSQCCRVCSHCYCQRMAEAYNNAIGHAFAGDEAMTRVTFADAVKCGSPARRGHSLLTEPTIPELMHSQGLNMSLLPFVFSRLPYSSAFAVEHFCKAEMCARVAADVLSKKLAASVGVEEAGHLISEFFSAFLSSSGTQAEDLWSKEIGPAFAEKYPSLGAPLFLSYLSPELLAERTQETCGVRLTEESFKSLQSTGEGENPFVRIMALEPKTKRFQVPPLSIEKALELSERLNLWLERILLFWIGCSSTASGLLLRLLSSPLVHMTEKNDSSSYRVRQRRLLSQFVSFVCPMLLSPVKHQVELVFLSFYILHPLPFRLCGLLAFFEVPIRTMSSGEVAFDLLRQTGPPMDNPLRITSSAHFCSLFAHTVFPKKNAFIFLVEFKRERYAKVFYTDPLNLGSWVVVPADRGQMCGIIVASAVWDASSFSLKNVVLPLPRELIVDASKVTRASLLKALRPLCGKEEADFFAYHIKRERVALRAARVTVQHLDLPMEILDCELQMDGERITFFFQSAKPVRFGNLTRDLFRLFHTRVWLENVNPHYQRNGGRFKKSISPSSAEFREIATLSRG